MEVRGSGWPEGRRRRAIAQNQGTHRRRSCVIPAAAGVLAEGKSSRGLTATRRNRCGGWPGLGHSRVAQPRRSRTLCAAEQRGVAERLGLGVAALGGRREARVPFVGRRLPWRAGLVWEGRRILRRGSLQCGGSVAPWRGRSFQAGPTGQRAKRARRGGAGRARWAEGLACGPGWQGESWAARAVRGKESLGCLRLGRPGGESGLGPVAEFWAGLV